jgi:hypothetical protein
MPDSSDPRTGRGRQPQRRFVPADWVPTPIGVRAASMGPPHTEDGLWWRLQPGRRDGEGCMVRRSVVHGGSCIDWPPGRAPADWTYHSRAEVRRLLARPDEVVACPRCQPDLML